MRSTPVAVLDANVLYPAQLRDLLLRLAMDELFRPHWSREIHDEWMRNLVANREDIGWENVEYTRSQMEDAFPGASVEGYKHRISGLSLPDPDDRHVLAAAIEIEANYIVTNNLCDFPARVLASEGICACSPDDFIMVLYRRRPVDVVTVVKTLRASLSNPPRTPDELVDDFQDGGLQRVATEMRGYLSDI